MILSGGVPRSSSVSNVGAGSGESCRLVPAKARPAGSRSPRPGWSVDALFARSIGEFPATSPPGAVGCTRRLRAPPAPCPRSGRRTPARSARGRAKMPRAIHSLRRLRIVVAGAGGVGDGLIRAVEPQHLHQLVEHDPIADAAAVVTQRIRRIDHRPGGEQSPPPGPRLRAAARTS